MNMTRRELMGCALAGVLGCAVDRAIAASTPWDWRDEYRVPTLLQALLERALKRELNGHERFIYRRCDQGQALEALAQNNAAAVLREVDIAHLAEQHVALAYG